MWVTAVPVTEKDPTQINNFIHFLIQLRSQLYYYLGNNTNYIAQSL